MESRDIVITGMGAVTPIGIGVDRYWKHLKDSRCGVSEISRFDAADYAVRIAAEVKDFHVTDFMTKKLANQTDAFTQYAFVAASEVLDEVPQEFLKDMGIVVGTAMGGVVPTLETQHQVDDSQKKAVSPRFISRILSNTAAAQVAIHWQITGPSLTLSTACASGNDAMIAAGRLIRSGEAERVLVIGTESILCPLVLQSLSKSGALSENNAEPTHACRPFDKLRDGFVIGEGAGAVLIESKEAALARNATIHGYLLGWASNNDAYSLVASEPHGAFAYQCMKDALKSANLSPSDVDYINAHGTGTLVGDAAEAAAIQKLFGDNGPVVSSTKAATGHMMAAGGITEAIACLKGMAESELPPTLNLDEPAFDLDFVMDVYRPQTAKVSLSNAFGFGGQNACVVLGAADL